MLFLPVVVGLVQLLLSHGFCLQRLGTKFFVLHQLLGDFVVLLDEAVVVIVKRTWQALLKPSDLVLEDLVLVDFVLHTFHLVGDIILSIFDLIIVFFFLFLKFYLFVLQHLIAGLLACG